MNERDIAAELLREVARILGEAVADLDGTRSLSELGLDSVGYAGVSAFIHKRFGVVVRPEELFTLSSLESTAAHLAGLLVGATEPGASPAPSANAPAPQLRESSASARDIAIVGLALKLPGATDPEQYWDLIGSGASMLREFPAGRAPAIVDGNPGYLKGGFVEDASAFDAAFFGISPREALPMDPQQRWFLECAWHAFESGGYSMARLSGSPTAVFVGASSFDYYELLLRIPGAARATHIGTGLSHAVIANRVSQYFNLKGASEAIDTACSSGLVALWRAVEALRRGESELALVGGVNVLASPSPFRIFADAGMLSPDGVCRPFDAQAAGYVRGEGVACVLLKRLADAQRDGDRIWAVVKGGAVRHSGRTNSLTAPNPEAQADVIVAAVTDASVDPLSIGYVEAHGTGTSLGDPIEVNGLKQAFQRLHAERGRSEVGAHFTLGSVKAQIGHLEAAAGLAGLLKGVLSLVHRAIPGSPYLTAVNPHIDLSDTCFRLATEMVSWDAPALPGEPRRVGVSSFGFGGVNSHVVLEEAPPNASRDQPGGGAQLLLLSAKSAQALKRRAEALAQVLADRHLADDLGAGAYLADLAFTLRQATPLAHRLAVVSTAPTALAETLRRWADGGGGVFTGIVRGGRHEEPQIFTSEAVRNERLRTLAAAGDLGELAALWVKGVAIEWSGVLPRASERFLSVPGYPFARDSFWVPADQPEGASAAARWSLYAQSWLARPLGSDPEPRAAEGTVVALIGGPLGQQVAELVGAGRRLVTTSLAAGSSAEPLRAAGGRISGLLDLTALDGTVEQRSTHARQRIEFVRELVGLPLKRGERLDVLQATLGLHGYGSDAGTTTLAGAQEVGFYKSLWAEHRRARSKAVDFATVGFTAEVAAAALTQELDQHDGPSEIGYAGGRRMVRVVEPLGHRPPEPEAEQPGAALITGGTGEIGLALAADLVSRGFRALLLTGRRELSAERRRVVDGLVGQGAAIALFRGDLCDEAALAGCLAGFRSAHGAISHVFHCAGAVSRTAPAFFQKTALSMAEVAEPKVDALWALHRAFVNAPPRAFVLFSSVSALAPKLAAGVLDYAAANCFLDQFAQYQHSLGHRYYRSVQWTRWKKTGLARDVPDGSAMGIALEPEQCLEALHRIAEAAELGPVVCVAAEGEPALQSQALERPAVLDSAQPAKTGLSVVAADAGEAMRRQLRAIVAKELEIDERKLDEQASFEELGIDSIVLVGVVTRLEQWLGAKLDPSELIKRNSLAAVASYLASTHDTTALPSDAEVPAAAPPAAAVPPFPVAVIGIACRFPGAVDKETFWQNLVAGLDSVGAIPSSRWDSHALYDSRHQPGRSVSRWGGFIEGIERFSPALFGLKEEDAADLDPLIRLFTEASLAAVLDSPYEQASLRGRRVGVFAGARGSRYAERIASPGKHSVTGVGQNFIAAFVSHVLDLRGPSLVLDSACSSSLAAVHLACQSLQCGDAELAIAGGVDLLLDEKPYLFLSAAHALSPDGRCRTFDERANGFVPGEGVGCVLLKPLGQALADGDHVYAVIDGSAINNDGHTLGVTTPGVDGQVDVIERALQKAGASPRQVSYVETHGTGTMIGDPIELRALARAFAKDPPSHCALGSVKTNVGHLLSAAGIASFIKVALALHHQTLPPTLHCDRINPRFEFERTPFLPVLETRAWAPEAGVRRAGISAFGFGKTNVHVILSERPARARRPVDLPSAPPAVAEADKIYAWHAALPASRQPRSRSRLLALENFSCETLDEA